MTVSPETPPQEPKPQEPTTQPQESNTPPAADSGPETPDVAALQVQLEEARAQAAAAKDAQLRALAEVDNVRKRAEREIASAAKFSLEKLLAELLAVCDSVDLGKQAAEKPDAQLKTLVEGLELTRRQLIAVLEKYGVTVVDPLGQPFNPDLHEAVQMVPSDQVAPNHVLQVMQKGYKLHERLLRPAMVVVARAP